MKILHVVLYDQLFPPKNGGMLRCWNLSLQLSLYFDTDLLCLQPGIENLVQQQISENKHQSLNFIVPPKRIALNEYKGIKKIVTAARYRWYYKTLYHTNLAMVDMIPLWDTIKKNQYEIIILEHLESLNLLPKLKALFPSAKFILDAHNVDHILLKNQLSNEDYDILKNIESVLYKSCHLIFTCSDKDATIFRHLNSHKVKVLTVPNGVDVNRNSYREHQPPAVSNFNILFCGSLNYQPNIDGLNWFIKNAWEKLVAKYPYIKFNVVGAGKPDEELQQLIEVSHNINFIGEVDEVVRYYRNAHLAVVPILHGSGTRLKILEAMSFGVPVISTSEGAEGIRYTDGQNIMIANNENEFFEKIENFITYPERGRLYSKNARELVEKEYSWDVIGKELSESLKLTFEN